MHEFKRVGNDWGIEATYEEAYWSFHNASCMKGGIRWLMRSGDLGLNCLGLIMMADSITVTPASLWGCRTILQAFDD